MSTISSQPDPQLQGTSQSFRSAVSWAYAMTIGQRGISMTITFILAALLGPEDFGTVAMATAYILFIETFVAQGMGAAIIQRKDLSPDHLDSVFWLLLGLSLALAGVSVALASWWAAVNLMPQLAPIITVLSLSVPIKGLTVVQQALLQRHMRFRSMALLTSSASIAGGIVGVVAALAGAGVWSLVMQQLIGAALGTSIMWKASRWRPRLSFSFRHLHQLLGFSSGMFASQLGVYCCRQLDLVLMGLFFGPVAVGLYRLADRLMELLLDITTRSIQIVSLPHFSSLQNNPVRLRRALLSCIRLSTTITFPAMALLGICGEHFVAMLGDEWAPASGVLRIIILVGIAKSVTLFADPLLAAVGRAKTVAMLTWFLALTSAAGIIWVGLTGAEQSVGRQVMAVALVQTAGFLVFGGFVRAVLMKSLTGCTLRQLLMATGRGAAVTCGVIATAVAVGTLVPSPRPHTPMALLIVLLPGATAAAILLYVLDSTVRMAIHRAARSLLPASGNEPVQP